MDDEDDSAADHDSDVDDRDADSDGPKVAVANEEYGRWEKFELLSVWRAMEGLLEGSVNKHNKCCIFT